MQPKRRFSEQIPSLNPLQFDDYIFQNWKPEVSGFYEKFHIERIERYRQHLNIPLLPHRRSVYFFIYLTNGNAVRSKGLTHYHIQPKQFFFLPAHQITSLSQMEAQTEGFYCHFKSDIFNHPFLKLNPGTDFPFFKFNGKPLVSIKQDQNILQLLSILEKEYRSNEENRFELIPIYLTALFSEISQNLPPTERSPRNAAAHLTQKYKDALSNYIYELKSVAEFADRLSVTPNHLHKSVKQTTGKSAHLLLQEMRILEAKVLLKQSALNVGEIASKLGKSTPSDFCRFFKKHTQMTPLQYRQST